MPDIRAGAAVQSQQLPHQEELASASTNKVMDSTSHSAQEYREQVPMDTTKGGEDRVKLDPIVVQCVNARKATGKIEAAAITLDENFGKRFVVEQDVAFPLLTLAP